ncbi:hypothetical protein AKG07_08825 [Microbacterium sp. CGR1]|nr:hypothetical protein AKG07_08825 [Microbacterium sp. CGR1]
MSGDSIRALTEIPDTLERHGVTTPKDVTKAVEKHATVIANINAIAAGTDPATAHESAARALADGIGTAEQVTTAAAAQMVAAKSPQSPYRLILSRARDLAASDLLQVFASHGDEWIASILRSPIDNAVKTLISETEYAPTFDAFMAPNAADHLIANPRVSDAWSTLRDLYAVARTLRRYRITAGSRRDDWYEWAGDGEYNTKRGGEHLQASVRDNMRADNLTWFLMAVQHGMTPTLLAESEIQG